MPARTDFIVQQVRNALNDPTGRDNTDQSLLFHISRVQEDIARRGFALKDSMDISFIAGTDKYDIQKRVWKIEKFNAPRSWLGYVEIVANSDIWAEITSVPRYVPGRFYVRVWNGWLYVFPKPFMTGEVGRLFYFYEPDKDVTLGTDPEVRSQWDNALILGTLARLGKPTGEQFEAEIVKWGSIGIEETNAPIQIDSPYRTLNF